MQQFEAVLHRPEGTGTWTYFTLPFSVEAVFGSKGQIKVKGTVNGVPYRSSAMPHGNGTHYMVVGKAIRDQAGVAPGDPVQVTMELDTEERTVEVPGDLADALRQTEEAAARFDKLAYSHQKEFVDWIESAKRPETRANRIAKAVAMVLEGKRPKG